MHPYIYMSHASIAYNCAHIHTYMYAHMLAYTQYSKPYTFVLIGCIAIWLLHINSTLLNLHKTQARIPGVIEAENFDALPQAAGQKKVVVKDAADPIGLSNRGGNFNYRPDAPTADIEACLTPDKVR
jgi:hypothetical protein